MNLGIQLSELLPKLNEASRFVGGRSGSPLLAGCYFSAQDDKLTLRTSNGSTIYETILPCLTKESGQIIVPVDLLIASLKSLDNGEVEFISTPESLSLQQGKTKMNIALLTGEVFPSINLEDKQKSFVIPTEEFVKNGKKALISASADETKPVLTSLMLEMSQPNALVTTDGFRLFRIQTELSLDQQTQILLPAKVFRDLFPILEKAEQLTITCLTTESNQEMVFQFGQTQVALSAIQGEFPIYRALIPENCAFSFSVDKELLQQKINQAMIFSREISSIVIFSVEENELIVSSQAGVRGKTNSRIPLLSLEGKPEKFACNGKYVLDFLSVLDSEGVKFQGNDPLKPILFSSPDDTSLLYLVMPFKLSE